jgi:hypothetical protein
MFFYETIPKKPNIFWDCSFLPKKVVKTIFAQEIYKTKFSKMLEALFRRIGLQMPKVL